MTQRTINLYDGLDALYYFDSDYFDGTTGEIKDKSGHGRHATAQGGPTIGVNGPNDFEATSFDGNDDIVDYDLSLPQDELTVLYIGKVPPSKEGIFELKKGGGVLNHQSFIKNNNLVWRFFDGAERLDLGYSYNSFGEFALNGVRFRKDYDYIDIIQEGNVVGNVNLDGGTLVTQTEQFIFGEIDTGTSNYFSGDLALSGIWNRGITDREIEYLNRLTAPRRAQL